MGFFRYECMYACLPGWLFVCVLHCVALYLYLYLYCLVLCGYMCTYMWLSSIVIAECSMVVGIGGIAVPFSDLITGTFSGPGLYTHRLCLESPVVPPFVGENTNLHPQKLPRVGSRSMAVSCRCIVATSPPFWQLGNLDKEGWR